MNTIVIYLLSFATQICVILSSLNVSPSGIVGIVNLLVKHLVHLCLRLTAIVVLLITVSYAHVQVIDNRKKCYPTDISCYPTDISDLRWAYWCYSIWCYSMCSRPAAANLCPSVKQIKPEILFLNFIPFTTARHPSTGRL